MRKQRILIRNKTFRKIYQILFLLAIIALVYNACNTPVNEKKAAKYIIEKKAGRIILAYKSFEDFLDTDRSWKTFRRLILDVYPEMNALHLRKLSWGGYDTIKFQEEILNYKKEDFERYFTQYTEDDLNYLYDSIIEKSHKILPPRNNKPVDLCLFLPYGSCFVIPEEDKNTIYVSMKINPKDLNKILAHEYGHILHFDRKPEESLTLMREVVSEGMAVYLTNIILRDIEFTNSIPFMPKESFEWCQKNEQLIKDSIVLELNDTTERLFKRYISDGSYAEPPKGFVEKTAYFAGYKIIDACIKQGMTIMEIASYDSRTIIEKSNYFK
jgi:uncharacterized protein YjaZ